MYADILQNNTVNFIASEIHLGGGQRNAFGSNKHSGMECRTTAWYYDKENSEINGKTIVWL